MKKALLMLLIMLMTATLCFANGQQEESGGEKNYTIKIGTTNQAGHPITTSLKYFGDLVNEYSDGTITVEVYSDGQLGDERDLVEGVSLGTMYMCLSSTGPVGSFAPKMDVLNLPYLFRDNAHAYAVLDGEIGEELAAGLLDFGIRNLCYWENGWRQLTNNKREINTPADLKGLKIRVMESQIMVATLNAMGASAVPMGWSEVITSLQQGILDGQENPIINNVYNGAYEVQKYLSLTKHFYNPSVLLINEDFYQGLSEKQRAAIDRAAIEARDYQRTLGQQMEEEALVSLVDKYGLVINENPDIEAFAEAVKPVYDEYADSLGGWDLINRIQNT